VLLPLFRYRDLYFFVNYSTYDNVTAWWHSSIQAVSSSFFVLGLLGCLISLGPGNAIVERLLAWAFLIYAGITLYLVQIDWPSTWTEQLETTRLMPFQRLLVFALAAIAVGRLAQLIQSPLRNLTVLVVAILIPLLYIWAPPSFIPESDRGLVRVGTMAEPGIADLQTAVTAGDAATPPDTAMLILATTAYWHDHMWANLWTDRLLFYDDWLWYWQTQNVGDYDPLTEHAYPMDSSTINEAYLHTHGIGVIVVTGEAKPFAATAPFLTRIRSGIYDVYTVNSPTTLATLDAQNLVSAIRDETVTIQGTSGGGTLTVRVNWFPRWQASDGLRVVHRPDGYMEITVPSGLDTVTLTYARTRFDWLASLIAVLCGIVALAFLAGIRPTARSAPRESSATSG
ncbi:MAG TPA: hypothetical protein PK819_13495, partial [Thermomicrobiales bacterium]|nr:hypothetical protein [Thermomicrobiales bacterium]